MWMTVLVTFQDIVQSDPEELASMHKDERITLQGFPYKTEEGTWILSSEPHLKSCCIGKKPTVVLQEVEGSFSGHQVVNIEGLLAFENGKLILKDTSSTQHTGTNFDNFLYIFLILIIVVIAAKIIMDRVRR